MKEIGAGGGLGSGQGREGGCMMEGGYIREGVIMYLLQKLGRFVHRVCDC